MITTSSKSCSNNLIPDTACLTIAIDGYAGAGKSTVAQKVAQSLNYLYIDTGAMYRAVTWVALQQKEDFTDTERISHLAQSVEIRLEPPDQTSHGRVRVFVNGSDVTFIIRSRIISRFVSPISAIAAVRKVLVAKQQQLAAPGAIVMDGRDIGTVVLPKAKVKIFLTASPEVRAKRRLKELSELGQIADYETVLAEIQSRDHFDTTREVSPLKQAEDAIVINTDNMTIDEVVSQILNLCSSYAK